MSETIDVKECAALLMCSEETVEELTRTGEIPGMKYGRGWLYVRADLLAYVAQRAREEAEERRSNLQGRRQPGKITDFRLRRQAAPALPQPLAKGAAPSPRP